MSEWFYITSVYIETDTLFIPPYDWGKYQTVDSYTVLASNCTFELKPMIGKGISLYGEAEFLKGITPTAEHTFALIHTLHARMRKQECSVVLDELWDRHATYTPAKPLSEMTMLILGTGRIGGMVATIASVYGMETCICNE